MALAIAAAIASFGYKAEASIGTTSSYSDINISMVVATNTPSQTINGTTKNSIGFAKIGNKQLLNVFAGWADTTWPAGAKLVVGWDWSGDVLVVDSTGTNVLFDADYQESAYFYIDYRDEWGAGQNAYHSGTPGFYQRYALDSADVEFYDDYYYLPYTYIYCYGVNTHLFQQSWNSNNGTWLDQETIVCPFEGDQEFRATTPWWETSARVSIGVSGAGSGYNPYWWD